MAGEGYRTWVPGEVITADNIQGYLQDQTVQVYPSSAVRGSALTGYIAEGMVSYLEDTNAVEVYNGSTWVGLGGDAPIFYTGTSGEFLKSLGTAGVEWDAIPLPSAATPTVEGIVPGRNTLAVGTSGAASLPSAAYGFEALGSATGAGNLAVGSRAGRAISTGTFNTILGVSSGTAITTGTQNTVIGPQALNANVSGAGNIAIGASALNQATGSSNISVGNGAGVFTTGQYNTTVGNGALAFTPSTGSFNTIVGGLALTVGVDQMNGNNNTVIGHEAAPSTTSVSNQITLGNSSITSLRCNVTSISSLSDERDKTDIEELPVGLDFVNALRPVRFTWNTRIPEPVTYPDGTIREFTSADVRTGVEDMGFIAQDLVAAEDELDAHDWLQLTLRDNPEKLEATQGRLIPILVKAIQELSAEVELLKSQVK